MSANDDSTMETTESSVVTYECDQGHTWPVEMVTQYEADPATGETPEGGHPSGIIGPRNPSETERCPECGSTKVDPA